ncbi:MAG: hypothetical protein JKY65_26270 [Planctomycetes bacterium]|nr:hypothetical protein [Planctomycetota bacterium]
MTFTVRARILLLTIAPVLLLAYPVLVYFPAQFAAASRNGLEAKLGSISRLLGHTLGSDLHLMASGGVMAADLEDQIAGLEDDGDVLRVGVYSAEAKFLAGLHSTATTAPSVEGLVPQGERRALFESTPGELRIVSRVFVTPETDEGEPPAASKHVGYLVIDASLASVTKLQSEQRATAIGIGGAALILGVLLALFVGTRISGSLTEATALASEVGRGNLRVALPEPKGSDELASMLGSLRGMVEGLHALEAQAQAIARCDLSTITEGEGDLHKAFAQMVTQQRELVHELSETATELETSSHEILATLRDQEAGANEQASAVEEARRTMISLLDASAQIADAAKLVHTNALRTKESSAETADRTGQLNQLTVRIGDVLIGITKIADRSDILALNAALEGTKAGEAGKGFILVAEEMRRLAENVLGSVRDISELVEAIRVASQASVLATEQGVKLSLETANSANQIRLTSQQQQSGTEQATQSMNEISEILTQALSGARQTTGAVEDLSQRASRLRELLSQYVLEDGRP